MSGRQKLFILLVLFGTMILSAGLILRFKVLPQWQRLSASSWARNLEIAAAAYHADHGRWPPQDARELLRALGPAPVGEPARRNYLGEFPVMQEAGIPVDPWQQPMQLLTRADGSLSVISSGPDRQAGSADDIDSSFASAEAGKLEAKKK